MQETDSEIHLVVTGTRRDGRRRYDDDSKQALVRACLQPGVSGGCSTQAWRERQPGAQMGSQAPIGGRRTDQAGRESDGCFHSGDGGQ